MRREQARHRATTQTELRDITTELALRYPCINRSAKTLQRRAAGWQKFVSAREAGVTGRGSGRDRDRIFRPADGSRAGGTDLRARAQADL